MGQHANATSHARVVNAFQWTAIKLTCHSIRASPAGHSPKNGQLLLFYVSTLYTHICVCARVRRGLATAAAGVASGVCMGMQLRFLARSARKIRAYTHRSPQSGSTRAHIKMRRIAGGHGDTVSQVAEGHNARGWPVAGVDRGRGKDVNAIAAVAA